MMVENYFVNLRENMISNLSIIKISNLILIAKTFFLELLWNAHDFFY